jgi:hypothetical protein
MQRISKYGNAAVNAVEYMIKQGEKTPRAAWNRAAKELFVSESSQKKGCPRATFLGLCQKGLVKSIPEEDYTTSVKNAEYGEKAVKLLKDNSELATDKMVLWKKITNGAVKHNSQMDVVIALWNEGLIEKK